MGFSVIHIEKGTAGKAGGLGSHIDRSKDVPNANPELTQYNGRVDLKKSSPASVKWTQEKNTVSLQKRINDRIKEGYTGNTAIRKDAVTHLNVVMTGSHEDMKRITNDKQLKEWANDNYKFASERFGKENIVEFTIHVDERTPHIHCVVVPLTADGRLSAKEVMGNRIKMSDLQEKYGAAMQKYNLDRGVKGSKATHDSIQEYYARINSVESSVAKINPPTLTMLKVEEPPRVLLNPKEWSKSQSERIFNNLKDQYNEREKVLKQNTEKIIEAKNISLTKRTEESIRLRKENAQLRGKVEEQDRILHPEKYPQQQMKEQDKSRNIDRDSTRGMRR